MWFFTTVKGGALLALCAITLFAVKILAGKLFPEKKEADPSNFLDLHFLNDLPNPTGSDCPTDLVDTPPFPKEIPALPTVEIIRQYKIPINRLVRESSLSEEDINAFLLPAVEKLVQIVHLLPASQEDHHSYEGGLLTHSLETATNAVIAAQNHIFDADEMPGQKYQNKQRWVLAAAIGGLAHDLGKVIRDIRVVDADTHQVKRMDVPMRLWIKHHNVRAYSINWTGENRTPKSHQGDSHFLLRSLLSDSIVNFLCFEGNPKIYQALRDAVYDMSSGPLGKILQDADIRSSSDDQVHRAQLSANNQIVQTSNASQICHAIQSLLTSGKWTYNHADSMVFVTREGCFLRWEENAKGDNQTAIDISQASRQLAAETHTSYVPRSKSIMFDNLMHGRVLLQKEKEGGYFWSICPITAKNKYIRCLRFHNAQHMFGFDMVPSMIEAHVYGSEASLRQKTAWLKEYGAIPDSFNQEGTTPVLKMESLIRKALGLVAVDNESQAYLDILAVIHRHTEGYGAQEVVDGQTGEISSEPEKREDSLLKDKSQPKKEKPSAVVTQPVEPEPQESSETLDTDSDEQSSTETTEEEETYQEDPEPVFEDRPECDDAGEDEIPRADETTSDVTHETMAKGKLRILAMLSGSTPATQPTKSVPRETTGPREPQNATASVPSIGDYKKLINELKGDIRKRKGKLLGNTEGRSEVSLVRFYQEADIRGLDHTTLDSLLKTSGIDVNFASGSVRIG